VAVVWCHRWHRHCVAVDVAIAAVILPAATACNCIAHRATSHSWLDATILTIIFNTYLKTSDS